MAVYVKESSSCVPVVENKYQSGDIITGTIFTAGFISNNNTVYFNIPTTKSGGTTTHTVNSVGFILRQAGKYILGTSGTFAYATISDVTSVMYHGYIHINVTGLTFTSATNNDVVGIYCTYRFTIG